jgi:organic radical activating enzyme
LIDIDKVNNNSRLLHNTDQKKADRRDMVLGKRPAGCEYCWKIEDMDTNAVSDRVYKSKIYEIKDINDAYYGVNYDQDINLKTLEISFDRTCQFACSYCNPAFSSTWVNDIRKHGPYNGLVSDGRNHFTHTHDSSQLYKFGETNPYVEAFFDWWERDLHRTLQELRITGGEPLMSGYTWKLIEWFKQNQGRSTTRLAINSNLGIELPRMMEFADAIRTLPEVELYTSMEATWAQAEYIRDGLDFNQWFGNMLYLLEGDFVNKIHVMGTINALCLTTLVDNLNMLLAFKQKYGRDRVNFTLNILRFPSFQSALVLPDNLRNGYRLQLQAWLFHNQNNPCLHEHEINHVQRLIDYLDVVKTPHSEAFDMPKLINDFKQFYTQYDDRRGKNFDKCFPDLSEWYGSIQI